jgi:hypothetical protein
MPDRRTPHRLTSTAALAVSIIALSSAARAQGGPGYAPPTTGAQPPAASPPSSPPPAAGAPPPAYAPGYAPPSGDAPPPPTYAPPPAYAPPPGNAPPPAYAPPPGYAPPSGYGPPQGNAPPPSGYAPPPSGYAPPPPGYGPPPPGYAPPPRGYATGSYYPPGYAAAPPEHLHDGFYLRLHLGAGYAHLSGTDGFGNTVTAAGGGASFGVAIGGAIAPNLIVFGTLFGVGFSPTVKVGGVDAGISNSSAALAGIGAGAAFYIEPINLYLSGAVAATSAEIDDSNNNALYQTRDGIGVQLMVGKEWWISQDWGIGLAGEFIGASMKDKNDSSVTWSADTWSLLLSTTYN